MTRARPDEDVAAGLAELPGWTREQNAISKTYEFPTFAGAILFVSALAYEAERRDHHPDLDIRWKKVKVSLTTHSQGRVTEKDLAFAHFVEETFRGA